MTRARPSTYIGVSLVSLCVLALELALTRLFSATIYYHFAFLAISIALFGGAASGVSVFLARRRLNAAATETLLGAAAASFAVTIVIAVVAVLRNPLATSIENPAVLTVVWIYVAAALPFFFAGCAITIAVSRYAEDISSIYFFDLVGAATGCLLLIPLLNRLGGVNGVLLLAVVAAVAAIMFSVRSRALLLGCGVVLTALVVLFAANVRMKFLDVRWSKGIAPADQIFSKWNSFSHVTVIGSPAADRLLMLIDGDAGTFITRNAGAFRAERNPRPTLSGLVYELKRNGNVLIIGPGGGNDVMTAREYGQKRITGVEVNGIIARDVMESEPFRSYSADLYRQPDVNIVVDEGRSRIRGSRTQFDVIQATLVDTWAATAAGAFALTENNLYTVEAFEDYIRHLTPDGILSISRWYSEPPDQLLRLMTITRQAMKELAVEEHTGIFDRPAMHFMIVKLGGGDRALATFLFKKSEFTEAEIDHIERHAAAMHMNVLYTPRTPADYRFAALAAVRNFAATADTWPSNIAATRDDNPFFFNTVRISRLGDALRGSAEWRKTNLGTFILFSVLATSAILVVLFIVGPLLLADVRWKTAGPGTAPHLLYFLAIGLGFILIEIALVQKFILFLGHPVYALAVVLFSILCFCGIGSAATRRIPTGALTKILAAVSILVVAYVLVLSPLFYRLVQLPQFERIVISTMLLAPLAAVMGMPMPVGIRIASARDAELIPWAWGLNGAASVLGSAAALAAAIVAGFNAVLNLGAAMYLVALLCALRILRADSASRPSPTS